MQKDAPAMREDESRLWLGRFGLGAVLALSLIAAALLTDAPGWHEYLHRHSSPSHLCVVTILAAGQCEATATVPIFTGPDPVPRFTPLPRVLFERLHAEYFFSLLE